MTNSDGTRLRGLPGDNPLGFLAALGVLVALREAGVDERLHWTNGPIPYPVVTPSCDLESIAQAALNVAQVWLSGPAVAESLHPKLKFEKKEIRGYLLRGREAGPSGILASCLLAEGSLDNSKRAKPTDLYFTAGNQKFVSMARANLSEATIDEIVSDLARPWTYQSDRDSLMWDTVDDRDHALSASDPAKIKKQTNPGAEALAIIGLSRYPCFASSKGTLTQGCSGSWKRGSFVWPLWTVPASERSVRALLAQVADPTHDQRRSKSYQGWGISRVMKSQIRRSDQGGYGTFGPPLAVWQRE